MFLPKNKITTTNTGKQVDVLATSASPAAALPKPDRFGNYYFGAKPKGPAIFRSSVGKLGRFFASTGCQQIGILFDGPEIRYFDTAEEALSALDKAMFITTATTLQRLSR